MNESVDVLVIGAGPAGSTIARLLANLEYSVLLLKGPQPRTALAESLAPSINNIFEVTGIRADVEAAGFHPDRGNTSWWGTSEPRIENYTHGLSGYHVERHAFDDLLLRLAEQAGVTVRKNSRAPREALDVGAVEHDTGLTSARFVVDATGRSGLLARQIRRFWDTRYKTIGLCGIHRSQNGWNVDPYHTVIEAYENGWAWSVPLCHDRRYVSFMVDSDTVRGGVEQAYRAELDRSSQFRELFDESELEQPPWGRDASLYYSERYAGPNWMLVGDAGSFVDPLSSYGVKKAMISALNGAAVINTCLSKPALAGPALELFNTRENETYNDHTRQAAQHFSEAARVFGTPFWKSRSQPPGTVLYRREELDAAFERLRRASTVQLRLSEDVRMEDRPVIRGSEVVMVNRPVLSGMENVEYMQGVHLATLAGMAPQYGDVGMLYESYAAGRGEVPLPNFLAALSLLVAKRILVLNS